MYASDNARAMLLLQAISWFFKFLASDGFNFQIIVSPKKLANPLGKEKINRSYNERLRHLCKKNKIH